jgi:hypothetical protein
VVFASSSTSDTGGHVNASTQSLLVGFLLTTVCGGLIGAWFQRVAWGRQARLELFKQAYVDGNELFAHVTNLVDRRYFRLYRWFMSIRDHDDAERIRLREASYFEAVSEWNETLRVTHNRVRMHFGERQALAFLDYADDFRPEDPTSLHYRFVRSTRLVAAAKSDDDLLMETQQELDHLNWALTAFANDATDQLVHRAISLRLLRPEIVDNEDREGLVSGPSHPGGTNQRTGSR